MPTLKGTEASMSYVQCLLYLVSSSINVSIFHSTWLDTFWTDCRVSSGCYTETVLLGRVGRRPAQNQGYQLGGYYDGLK